MNKVSDWLILADNDFKTARAALEEKITNTACFHAHQTAEKALKVILLSNNQEIPRVHDLLFLLEKVQQYQKDMSDYKSACQFLNNFYISTRYPDAIPGDLPEGLPALEVAKQAVEQAKKILDFTKAIMAEVKQKGFAPIIILVGILIVVLAGGGGYYFFKTKKPPQIACTLEAKICPDGTSVGRSGLNCEFAPCPNAKDSDFEKVTMKQLIENRDNYNGKKVLVKGKYQDQSKNPIPICVPSGDGKNPQIRDEYHAYPSLWVISEGTDMLGVKAIDQSGSNSTLPNYQEGQQIELKGIAITTTVPNICDRDIRYKSIYLEVKVGDIDISSKPTPETLPDLE